MIDQSEFRAWIFVSHSSEDLGHVRKVRNYLEEAGASPLIFHLLSLKEPEQFWPIIEREISERNFFLYCQSEAAEKSDWVQRERKLVDLARRQRPIRIGQIRVDSGDIDTATLNNFLTKVRVFPSFSNQDRAVVAPFLKALTQNGFMVFSPDQIRAGEDWQDRMRSELELASKEGWVVIFISQSSMRQSKTALRMAQRLGARVVIADIETLGANNLSPELREMSLLGLDLATGPQQLVQMLLERD